MQCNALQPLVCLNLKKLPVEQNTKSSNHHQLQHGAQIEKGDTQEFEGALCNYYASIFTINATARLRSLFTNERYICAVMQKQSSQQAVKSLNSAVHHSESGMGEYDVL